jgi:hypothetical protein
LRFHLRMGIVGMRLRAQGMTRYYRIPIVPAPQPDRLTSLWHGGASTLPRLPRAGTLEYDYWESETSPYYGTKLLLRWF